MAKIKDIVRTYPDIFPQIQEGTEEERRKRYEEIVEKHSEALDQICQEILGESIEVHQEGFEFGKELARKYSATLEDIQTLFNQVLPSYQDKIFQIGPILSGLYHEIIQDGDTLKLDVRPYHPPPRYIGFRHPRGRLMIEGDVGYGLGEWMEGGEIYIKGDYESLGRNQQGGIIYRWTNLGYWPESDLEAEDRYLNWMVGYLAGKRLKAKR